MRGVEPAARPSVGQVMPQFPMPATFVVSRVMRPGREDAYEPWVRRLLTAAQTHDRFAAAVRLDQAGGLHHLLLQFGGPDALQAWLAQPAYRDLAAEAEAFSVGLDQRDSGKVVGFTLPSEVAAKKWRTALVTWIGVVPTLLIVSGVIGWALPALPRVLQQILSSVVLTAALTWLILPRVRGWSRFWMLQDSRGKLRKDSD
jgi:antibiotic biosynthesis monooxygenase (ABM) superfamily enzyme